jgi:hypothetical protein
MATETGQVMRRKNPYVMMDVTSLRDNRLSWKAKGLMTYFLDKPDDWKFIMKHIYNASTDGERAVKAGLKELQKYGYLVRVGFRKNNRMDHFQFLVYEEPVEFPSEKTIYVDYDKWNMHIHNGGSLDITLLVQNELVENELVENELVQNVPDLLSINSTKVLGTKNELKKDIYTDSGHAEKKEFQFYDWVNNK